MAGCLDKCTCPDWEIWNVVKERRNFVASVTGGALFSAGWWIVIDAAVMYPSQSDFHHACHTIGVFATLALFMINSVSNSAIRGDNYVEGCFGQTGSRVWFFIGFILSFGSLIAASGVLFGVYVVPGKQPNWPGIALFLQNACIFFGNGAGEAIRLCSRLRLIWGLIFKFGRTEEQWG